MRLSRDFYSRSAEVLAPNLLGKLLCRRLEGGIIRYRITETEAYVGEEDTACHAHRGKTPRNAVMYGQAGTAYIYLCYGIHNLLNIVAAGEGEPEAVLIRGVEGFPGPGRLTKAMSVGRSLNGADLTVSEELWLEDDGVIFAYEAAPRIGIDYASDIDRARLWRFTAIYDYYSGEAPEKQSTRHMARPLLLTKSFSKKVNDNIPGYNRSKHKKLFL